MDNPELNTFTSLEKTLAYLRQCQPDARECDLLETAREIVQSAHDAQSAHDVHDAHKAQRRSVRPVKLQTVCRFGRGCRNYYCAHMHPMGRLIQEVCKYGTLTACKRTDCVRMHVFEQK